MSDVVSKVAAQESASASSQVEPPPWESPQWQEAVSQNPGLAPFFDNLESFVELPEGVEKLRGLVLRLAVQGQIVQQEVGDEPATDLLLRVTDEKKRLHKAGEIRKPKASKPIDESELRKLPTGWCYTRMNSFIELVSGQHLKPDSYNEENDGHPYFTGPADFGPDHPVASRWTHEDRALAIKGDVLITVKGAGIGKTNTLDVAKAFISRQLMAVRPILVDKPFTLLVLQAAYDLFQDQGQGIAIPGIGRDDILEHLVPLPPLAEQRRIVSKVEGLMSLCDTLESQRRSRESVRERASRSVLASLTSASAPLPAGTSRATSLSTASGETLKSSWQRLSDHFEVLLDQPSGPAHLRQSILQLAVQGKLVPQDPNDEPASKLVEAIQNQRRIWLSEKAIKKPKSVPNVEQPALDAVPPGWTVDRLGNLIDARFTISYGVLVPGPDTPGGIPLVRIKDLALTNAATQPNKSISKTVEEKYARTRLVGGEILLGVVGSIGKLGVAPASWAGANVARAVCRIAAPEQLCRDYLVIALACEATQTYFIDTTRTLAQPTLNVGDVEKTLIPLPPLAEQKRIVSKVSVLLSQLDELSVRLRSRQSTTDALLTALIHQILNGANSDGN